MHINYIYTHTSMCIQIHIHVYILYICVCVSVLATQLCLILETSWTVARQAPLSMGFSRQEYWRG